MQGQGDIATRRRPAASDRRQMPTQELAALDRVTGQDVARWRDFRSGKREGAAR